MPRHKHQSQFEEHNELASVFRDERDGLDHQSDELTQAIEQPPQKNLPVEEQNVNNIDSAPKDGTNIIVMKEENDPGMMAYWRKTRYRKNHQWIASGLWSNTLTHMSVGFDPKYWKDADAVNNVLDASILHLAKIAELERQVAELSRHRVAPSEAC